MPAPARVATGAADPPWPTPAEGYLAALAAVTSMSVSTHGRTVELDTAQIVAAVADALLWTGALPPNSALAVIESIARHENLLAIELYGHPWVTGEYWPMIAPCFQVRAVDDTGCEHQGMPGSGGGSPEASWEIWFWPPLPQAAKRIRVVVSTLWEAAWADLDIPRA
jgi:hypothetical protein